MRNRNASRVLLTFVLAIAMALPFLTSNRRVAAANTPLTGAIFTTDRNGNPVNANIYDDCCDVCLNGGPTNCTSGSGLPDGDYYFQVTDPSGANLLSSDGVESRRFTVVNGFMTAYVGTPGEPGSCNHEVGISPCAATVPTSNAICIELMPFAATPNPGNEYKVWITPVLEYDPTEGAANFGFSGRVKTDNFKCRHSTETRQSAIGGVKFTDLNGNCIFDAGEPTIEGVEIDITLADNTVVKTFTDEKGVWALVFDEGTTFTACEVVPAGYRQQCPTEGQTANDSAVDPVGGNLAATADKDKCWVGTVTGADTASLNFANVLCKPSIICPADVPACTDKDVCSAVVSYTTPTATDDCGGSPGVVCSPPSGSVFEKGSTTVTCTATHSNGQTAQCTFKVIVSDCQSPTIHCPDDKKVCNDPGKCSAVVTFTASANDNCDGTLTPTCDPASGSTFAIGTTPVTCTVQDAAGNPARCSFNVTVDNCTTGSISGKKFYDANKNGLDDDGQVVVGWKVVLSGSASDTKYTDGSGNYSFGPLGPGTYTVTEVAPNNSWTATTGTSCTFTISCENTSNDFRCVFGNYCTATPGGLTIGFWSNKNGQKLITAVDLQHLRDDFCLKNANGSEFDPTTAALVNSFLLSANASNMANMLSAQLIATYLNVIHGFTNGGVFVDGTNTVSQEITYANSLLCGSAPCIGYAGISVAAGPCRTEQERVKNILDKINNGGSFSQPAPCSFTTPY